MIPFSERRRHPRALLPGVLANKFIDGRPYMVEIIEATKGGFSTRRIREPETTAESFSVELSVGGPSFFAYARRVRREGARESYRFVAVDAIDRARLQKFLHTLAS